MKHLFQEKVEQNREFFEERQNVLVERNISLARVLAIALLAVYVVFQVVSVVIYHGLDLRLQYSIPCLILALMWPLGKCLYKKYGITRFLSYYYPMIMQCYLLGLGIWMDLISEHGLFQIYTPLGLVIGPILFFLPLKTEVLINTVVYAVYMILAVSLRESAFAEHAFFQTSVGYVLSLVAILYILGTRQMEEETYVKLKQEQRFREEIEAGRSKARELQGELQTSRSIVDAVTDIYYVLYECDLIHDTFECIQGTPMVRDFTKQYTNAYDCLQEMTYAMVVPDDQRGVADFYDTHRWQERLKDRDTLSIEFKTVQTGWSRGNLIVAKRDSEGRAVIVLSAIQDIHEVKEQSIAYEKNLQKALAKAQEANLAKTNFLNSMSHDIRTPMNAIIGFSTLAQDHLHEPELMQDYLYKITTASKHLLSLIDDVLDMSLVESGNVEIHETAGSLRTLMHEMNSILEADLKAKDLKYCLEIKELENDNVYFDKLRLNQILLNVISNAIKYTNPGGTIRVLLEQKSAPQNGAASYHFSIKDTGIGIKPEFLEHIFEPFTRARTSTDSGIQGTGLGLAITKNLVELMHGQIEVHSEADHGTEVELDFQFRIAENEQPPETQEEVQEEVRFDGERVLLVEDNELNREIAMELLKEKGLKIETAENGKIGAEMFGKSAPGYYSLILMDIQMPVMDGYKATKMIREMEREDAGKIPILALTANAFSEDSSTALEIGMNEYLTKPFRMQDLENALSKYLNGGQKND